MTTNTLTSNSLPQYIIDTFEGKQLTDLFRYSMRDFHDQTAVKAVIKWVIESGNKVYVKMNSGIRTGSIAELVITDTFLEDKWRMQHNQLCSAAFEFKFDDRKNPIKLDHHVLRRTVGYPAKFVNDFTITFEQQPTVFKFTTNSRPKTELKTPKDHFGNPISKGQKVIFVGGRGSNKSIYFGTITRWSDVGNVWAKVTPSRSKMKASELMVSSSSDIVPYHADDSIAGLLLLAQIAM